MWRLKQNQKREERKPIRAKAMQNFRFRVQTIDQTCRRCQVLKRGFFQKKNYYARLSVCAALAHFIFCGSVAFLRLKDPLMPFPLVCLVASWLSDASLHSFLPERSCRCPSIIMVMHHSFFRASGSSAAWISSRSFLYFTPYSSHAAFLPVWKPLMNARNKKLVRRPTAHDVANA